MPNNIDRMLDHILFLARKFRGCEKKYVIMIILLELNVSPKTDGYKYLVRIIELYMDAPAQVSIKSLYIALSALYNGIVDADQIEQSVRNAIKQAWKKKDNEKWTCFFLADDNGECEKPTNAEFVAMIACVMELWKGWCEAYEKRAHTKEDML